MTTNLEAAKEFVDSAVQDLEYFYQAGKPSEMTTLAWTRQRGLDDIQLALAAAAIAQAEAQERTAQAMERIADMWESALINVAPGDQRWLALRTYDAVSAERYYAP